MKQNEEAFLFVYGTLRRHSGAEMVRFLESNARFMDEATFQGKLYKVDSYPGAVSSQDPSAVIHGEVYRLFDPVHALARLDQYEECGSGFSQPTEFVRTLQPVQLGTGESIKAWVYLYNRPTHNLEQVRSGDFSRCI